MSYALRHLLQLQAWKLGAPYHNRVDDECCPDFSCCQPSLLAGAEVRREYFAASAQRRHGWQLVFLSRALEAQGSDVHIAGLMPEEKQ